MSTADNGIPTAALWSFAVLMSQLSSDAMLALQMAFRPVVHPGTFHLLNQYAAFMSDASGEVRSAGGLAQRLDRSIQTWTYAGMPDVAKVSSLQHLVR